MWGRGDTCDGSGVPSVGCSACDTAWRRVPASSPLSFKDITALELSCMAEYGGPVFPYIAVGGYSGTFCPSP